MSDCPAVPSLPPVIGHRGLAGLAPENTAAGFRAAARRGLRWVEVDVRPAACGRPVLMHDAVLGRTTNGSGPLEEKSYAELAKLDAGSWFGAAFAGEVVPALDDALALLAALGLGVNLEIKPGAGPGRPVAPSVVEAVQRAWSGRAPAPLLSSFDTTELALVADIAPELPRSLLVDRPDRAALAQAARLGCVAMGCADEFTSDDDLRWLHCAAPTLALMVFTVDDGKRAAHLRGLGVSSVFSDRPDERLASAAA